MTGRCDALILGGLGLIGTHLYRDLFVAGRSVVVADNGSGENLANLAAIRAEDFRYLDIRDASKLRALLAEVGARQVYVLAAHFANQNSVDHPLVDASVNLVGQVNIVEAIAALPANRRPEAVFYASSSCVYGSAPALAEEASVYPHETPYAINKYAAEMHYAYLASHTGIACRIGRLFNVYGAYERASRYRNVIPRFIDDALAGRPLTITGTGAETRDFTHAPDVAACIRRMTEGAAGGCDVFNIGSGEETAIGALAERIVALTKSASPIEFRPRRGWDRVTRRRACVEKLRKANLPVPASNLDGGLAATVDWYRDAGRWLAAS